MQLEEPKWTRYVEKAAGENAARYHEVAQFMHLQAPRALPHGLLKPMFSKGGLVVNSNGFRWLVVGGVNTLRDGRYEYIRLGCCLSHAGSCYGGLSFSSTQ